MAFLLAQTSFTTFMASLFACFLFLFSLFWISRRAQKTAGRKELPPEAGGAWPVIGHLRLLRGPQLPHVTLGNMADKYGPIFTIWLGAHQTLVVSSWEITKECFTTNDKAFASRPKGLAPEVMGYNYAIFALSPYSLYWSQVRKIAVTEVLSNHRVEMLKHIRESEVNASIKEIYELWVRNNRTLVEMKRWFQYTTLNLVFRTVLGKRFGPAVPVTKDESEGNDQFRKALRDFFRLSGVFVISNFLPYLRWLDVGGYEKAMKKTAKELDNAIEALLEEHKQRKISDEVNGHGDFMDVMLSTITDDISGYDAHTITKATCLALVLGGTDTSITTLTWALSLLLNNREALNKAQQELNDQVGRERQVKESDVKNLVYIQAVLKETMRLYPPTPLSLPRESIEDCTLAGYHVPARTRLLVNLSKLHRDPRVWSQPNDFQPERFLTTHQGIDLGGQHFEFLPFGSGRRVCPGASFALHVLHLTLARLLHSFELATEGDQPVDMTEGPGLTAPKATPLEVLLTPRLPANLYGG